MIAGDAEDARGRKKARLGLDTYWDRAPREATRHAYARTSVASTGVRVRPYRDEDAAATLEIYERAVHQTGAASYSPEQLAAWAPLNRDTNGRADWSSRRAAAETVVAVEEDRIAGFSDLVDGTLLDMLFVDPSFGRRGIGSLLIQSLVALAWAAGSPYVETHASLVARPVFERHGFVVISEEKPVIRGVELTNFKMRRGLGHDQRSPS